MTLLVVRKVKRCFFTAPVTNCCPKRCILLPWSTNMNTQGNTMNSLGVNKIQRYVFKGTAPVTSCCTPKRYNVCTYFVQSLNLVKQLSKCTGKFCGNTKTPDHPPGLHIPVTTQFWSTFWPFLCGKPAN